MKNFRIYTSLLQARFYVAFSICVVGLMAFPAASSASDVRMPLDATCSMAWANALATPLTTIVENAKGVFVVLGAGIGLVLLVGYAFLHWTKWRGEILTGLAAIVIVAVGLIAWPSFYHSITAPICH